jgi:hypothetical protein
MTQKHGKTTNQLICVKNFDVMKGGRYTCLDCPQENTCGTLLKLRCETEKYLGWGILGFHPWKNIEE